MAGRLPGRPADPPALAIRLRCQTWAVGVAWWYRSGPRRHRVNRHAARGSDRSARLDVRSAGCTCTTRFRSNSCQRLRSSQPPPRRRSMTEPASPAPCVPTRGMPMTGLDSGTAQRPPPARSAEDASVSATPTTKTATNLALSSEGVRSPAGSGARKREIPGSAQPRRRAGHRRVEVSARSKSATRAARTSPGPSSHKGRCSHHWRVGSSPSRPPRPSKIHRNPT